MFRKIFLMGVLLALVLVGTVSAASTLTSAPFYAQFGSLDNARPNSLYIYSTETFVYSNGSTVNAGTHICRTNGAGDDPSANGLIAMYQENGSPVVIAQKQTNLRIYRPQAIPEGIRQCVSQVLPAPTTGAAVCTPNEGSTGIVLANGIRVENRFRNGSFERVIFYTNDCKILGRTNGHTDNGKMLSAWLDENGVPYAQVLRPGTNGRNPLIVITPRNNPGSVKLVNIIN